MRKQLVTFKPGAWRPTVYINREYCWRVWFVARRGSAWIGWHWSPGNKRLCVNLLPCLTLAIVLPSGRDPK